jgi:hypothetical protein
VVDYPLWETHPATHGTLDEFCLWEIFNQFEGDINVLSRIGVDRLCGSLGELITKFVDGSTH